MHREVTDFVSSAVATHRIKPISVLECGSRNINGTIKGLFSKSDIYVGVDAHEGGDVDKVALVHELPFGNETFDLVMSLEMLEHDPFYIESLTKMAKLVRKNGSLIITCAGPKRPEHNLQDSPIPGYYKNMDLATLTTIVLNQADWSFVHMEDDRKSNDLRALFHRKVKP